MMAYLPPDKSSGSSATPEPFPAGLTITAAKKRRTVSTLRGKISRQARNIEFVGDNAAGRQSLIIFKRDELSFLHRNSS